MSHQDDIFLSFCASFYTAGLKHCATGNELAIYHMSEGMGAGGKLRHAL